MKPPEDFNPQARPLVTTLVNVMAILMAELKAQRDVGVPRDEIIISPSSTKLLITLVATELTDALETSTDEVVELALDVGLTLEILRAIKDRLDLNTLFPDWPEPFNPDDHKN